MLPQTQRKLRWFSLLSLLVGAVIIATLWFLATPSPVVKGVRVPGFWEMLVMEMENSEELEWRLGTILLTHDFFSNLLRFLCVLTVSSSVLALVVVINDVRLTRK